ncbi:tectonic-like complex member Mks1, partial [Condylostylus longicornis]|uniref:tectonic-like complex member Mks1 n=1 Tax=Condylostylus longicornis TaxID=2530218 RepID=UPI00244DD9D7
NLKVNVTLKTISSLLKLEKFNLKTASNSNPDENKKIHDYENDNGDDNDDSIEIINLEWQQKVFSRYEIEYYKDIQNCITDLQKEYHEWIIRDNLDGQIKNGKHNKIFTYVDSDHFIPVESNDSFPQRSTEKETTLRAKKYSHPYTKSKVMYIYADLNPDTLLFMFRWLETEQMLIVYPDFNEFHHNPYFIEIDSDYHHLYSYAVQNTSVSFGKSISPTTLLRTTPQMELQNQISSGFYDMPPKHYIRVNFLFNIKEAHNFEYNSLHVRYYIRLPFDENSMKTTKLNIENGKLLEIPNIKIENGHLNGTTHSTNYNWGKNNYENYKIYSGRLIKIWNFSYPFQICLLLREKEFQQNYKNSLKIYFELISIDSWKRERTEGYSFLLIPIETGLKNFNLNCYRPDYGIKDRIERFFIGGRKLFNYENFNNTNCLEEKKTNSGMTLDDILNAYQEARKRLEATTLISNDDKDETTNV